MKQTKNSVLSLYLQHIKDLVVMLGNTSDWEFVIGDIDVIDDGSKKKLYFINEKSKKIEIANAKIYYHKYKPDSLESLSTGLSVIADLSGNNNKENRISKLKNILIDELSIINDDGTKFNNEGLNKQYSTISNEIKYIDYVTNFHSIDSIIKMEDTSGLEKILVDKLKDVFVSSPAASWSNILKIQKNEHEINYSAKVLLSFFGKDTIIDSIREYVKIDFAKDVRYRESDIVYILKYVKSFCQFKKNYQDEFEELLDFCFYKYADSLISDSNIEGDKYLRFNAELIRLLDFVEFKPNSMYGVDEDFLDDLISRLVISLKKVLSEKNKPICLFQDFSGKLSNDWAHKFTGYHSTSTIDDLRKTIDSLKIYNKFLEKLIEIKDDIKFAYKNFSLIDIFVPNTFGRSSGEGLLKINNELRFYSESETAKNFLLEHQKSCELFSQLVSEDSIDLQVYKMDIEFLIKKMELMAKSDYGKLEPKVEFYENEESKSEFVNWDNNGNLMFDTDNPPYQMIDKEIDYFFKVKMDSAFKKITF